MFIMGVSTYFSLKKYDFKLSTRTAIKLLRRTAVIFLIGLGVAWLGLTLRGVTQQDLSLGQAMWNFDHIRILGVMPRLALCYGVGSLIALVIRKKFLPWAIAVILVAYAIILLAGNGLEFSRHNVIAVVDRAVLGEPHMYSDTIDGLTLKFDPEGLLSTIPAIAHMLIGFLCGGLILSTKDNTVRLNKLFIVGTILTFAGFLLSYGLPINKKIWSPTFVLTTCGLASSFLALLIWIIDIKGYKKWCRFFEAYGVNPLFMYVFGTVLSLVISFTKVPYEAASSGMISVKGWIYQAIMIPVAGGDETFASLLFALTFVCVTWCVGYVLYKNKIYIKI
jgi:predicted acyltransferase